MMKGSNMLYLDNCHKQSKSHKILIYWTKITKYLL